MKAKFKIGKESIPDRRTIKTNIEILPLSKMEPGDLFQIETGNETADYVRKCIRSSITWFMNRHGKRSWEFKIRIDDKHFRCWRIK